MNATEFVLTFLDSFLHTLLLWSGAVFWGCVAVVVKRGIERWWKGRGGNRRRNGER